MSRPKGVPNKRTVEFDELYDKYVKIYGDPVELLFGLMTRSEDLKVSTNAAKELLRYKWPTKKAMEIQAEVDGKVEITWQE